MKGATILGYGEDFLTLWAVYNKLDDILRRLEDESDPNDCLVIFRPSFGRAGGTDSAQFGEFDSIIITPRTVYLVESKWDRSGIRNNTLRIEEVQILRHNIFKWYHNNWNGEDWRTFIEKFSDDFYNRFQKPIAPEGSLLSRNLLTVLKKTNGKLLKNVLLFLHQGDEPKFDTDFKIVSLIYQPIYGNYIGLKCKNVSRNARSNP